MEEVEEAGPEFKQEDAHSIVKSEAPNGDKGVQLEPELQIEGQAGDEFENVLKMAEVSSEVTEGTPKAIKSQRNVIEQNDVKTYAPGIAEMQMMATSSE